MRNYAAEGDFAADKTTIDQITNSHKAWISYIKDPKSVKINFIKRIRTSRIKYKVETAGEYTLVTRDAIRCVQEAYLIEGDQKTKLTITSNRDLTANLKSGINEVDFIFKPYEDASLYGAFKGTPIYELPENCFDNFNSITNLTGIFMNCTQLKNIPIDVFKLMYDRGVSANDAFNGCTALEYLPGDIFYNCNKLQQVNGCFNNCTSLKEIPSDLFSKCPNMKNMGKCFYGCTSLTGSTPKYWNIFSRSMGSNCFYDCTGLTEYKEYRIPTSWGLVLPSTYLVYDISNSSGAYNEIKLVNLSDDISSITILNDPDRTSEIRPGSSLPDQRWYTPTSPENPTKLYVKIIFKNVSESTNAVFQGCTSLTSIPADLFDCWTILKNANNTFMGCSGLTSIPGNLFSKCKNINSAAGTFSGCTGLTSIPDNLFSASGNNLTNVSNCFYGCTQLTALPEGLFNDNAAINLFNYCFYNCNKLTGNAPYRQMATKVYYWNRGTYKTEFPFEGQLTGTRCFYGCTGLTQYSTIPTGWK